jgi:hypothetical protein
MAKIIKMDNGNFIVVHGKTGKKLVKQPRQGYKNRCDAQNRKKLATCSSFGRKSSKCKNVPSCKTRSTR